jgi:dephospho-CoA kinase
VSAPPLLVGLTGNIASGKSTVAARLRTLGAHVIDADALARAVVAAGEPALAAIAARWPAVIAADGTLDRAALRQRVFADPAERAALEAITHPAIAARRDAALAAARAAGARVVVYDVPLLFEAGLTGSVDRIVLVDAPEPVRRERLMRDRGLSAADADAAIAAQWPSARKRPLAQHVLDNDGTPAELLAQVDALWAALARHPAHG